MEEPTAEEDTKRFDAEHGANEEDQQPDPDEPLLMEAAGRVWLVKFPKYLMEKWSQIDAEGVHLATIRVYPEAKSANGKTPRILLTLPPNPETPNVPGDEYEMDLVQSVVENQIVIAEREKEPGTGSRARTTIFTGQVQHECNVRPSLSNRYRERVRERSMKANTPQRQVKRIEDVHPGGRGAINALTSGAAHKGTFDFVKGRPKPAKGQFERMARMPRNQLLDQLFQLFQQQEHWSIKVLRERTQQPEAYLKEVLSEIGFLHRSGEHNGMWELLSNFKGAGVTAANVPGPSHTLLSGVEVEDIKMEGDEDDEDDEDEDDDDDMEEVS